MRRLHLDWTDLQLIAWTLAAKLGVLALGMLAVAVSTGSVPWPLEPWHRWDAPHYTDIAVFGYRADDPGTLSAPGYRQRYPGDLDLYIVFYPLYPWLVGAVNAVIGAPILAAFAVTSAASLFIGPLLYRVVAADLGARIGRLSVAFLLIFPTAYFLHIGYTESLFLALALGSFWFARTDRWWLAGLLAALATLARVNGLVLLPALAVEAWLQWRADPDRAWRWPWLAAPAGAAIGFVAYLGLNLAVYGDALAFAEIQRAHWFKSLSAPWDGIGGVMRWLRSEDPGVAFMLGGMELAFIGLGLAGTVASALRFRPSWTAWMAGNWLLFVSTGFVLSVPRYSLVLFGLIAWFALLADRWRWAGVLLAVTSAIGLGYFAWRFAAGQWAF